MNTLYILVIFIIIPVFYTKIREYYYLTLNRLYLPNRIIQDNLKPMIMQALKENNFVGYDTSEFTDIKILKVDDKLEAIVVELFIINKNEFTKWNPVERLVKIVGYKQEDIFFIKSLEDMNSRDLGMLIPENSNIPLNRLFRSRRWDNQKTNWDEYKKDWDIKYGDLPI